MKTIKKYDNFLNEELDLFGRKAKKQEKEEEEKRRLEREEEEKNRVYTDQKLFDRVSKKIMNNFDESKLDSVDKKGYFQITYNLGEDLVEVSVHHSQNWSDYVTSCSFYINGEYFGDIKTSTTLEFARFMNDKYKEKVAKEKESRRQTIIKKYGED